ncbi:MAG: hypothetical protein ACLQVM_17810, partial [Terriglobia bacterium]
PLCSGVKQAAEKPRHTVILSEAKNLALSVFKAMRDPSSPAAPQDDSPKEFFRSLLNSALPFTHPNLTGARADPD